MIEMVKQTPDGSQLFTFNGVEFWTNREGVIMSVPSNKWGIVDELVSTGLAVRKFYKHLMGHVDYTLIQ